MIFLDVDGVVNQVGRGLPSPWPDSIQFLAAPSSTPGMRYKIMTSPRLGEALVGLGADIHWLTTWGHDANKEISFRAGLPIDLPVAAAPDDEIEEGDHGLYVIGNWKFAAILRHIDNVGTPFIWIDDDAIDSICRETLSEVDIPHLLVRPRSDVGLTPEHIEGIEAFISTLTTVSD